MGLPKTELGIFTRQLRDDEKFNNDNLKVTMQLEDGKITREEWLAKKLAIYEKRYGWEYELGISLHNLSPKQLFERDEDIKALVKAKENKSGCMLTLLVIISISYLLYII